MSLPTVPASPVARTFEGAGSTEHAACPLPTNILDEAGLS